KLFGELRADLDRAFRDAHAQVAAVIHSLQQAPSARDAARARERLLALRARADETAARGGEPGSPGAGGAGAPPRVGGETGPLGDELRGAIGDERDGAERFDWSRARPGDRVTLPGGRVGTVVALPDRRGRARVQVGTARLEIPADQVRPAAATASRPPAREPARVRLERAPEPSGPPAAPLDLRGLRVDEALTRLERALDDAALHGRARLAVVHGLGTGALRAAVREHLARSPYVVRLEDPEPSRAGDGASVAVLRED
ncbi:MAG TPA: Smr/MutS family protein, partial [Myxococcota bacterium]|nr:Smr/MutS family protein [Myxococcota bacterium]